MSAPIIKYSDRLVAFLDVMGFQELLKNGANGERKLQEFYNTIFDVVGYKSQTYSYADGNNDDFKWLIVSDAIVLSVKLPSTDVTAILQCSAKFFSAVRIIQRSLASDLDIWTRGAISAGKLFIDDETNVLVGPAFVRAYQLEKTANYPRVIIDPQILAKVNMGPIEFSQTINSFNYPCLLLAESSNRFGVTPYYADAIQIDWFHDLLNRPGIGSKKFFEGVKNRMTTNQDLFQKSTQLGRYLRESYYRWLEVNKKNEEVEKSLSSLGF